MIPHFQRSLLMPLLAALATACVSVSPRDGVAQVTSQVIAAGRPAPTYSSPDSHAAVEARTRELLAAPLTARSAVEVGILSNPRLRSEFAQLGIAQSDLVAASRLSNPVLSGSRTTAGGSRKSTLALTQSLSDLILLSARRRLAAGEYERVQQLATAAILDLAADIEAAWFRCVGAEHVAAMRGAVANAATVSSDLAQRFYGAGNISELQLMMERSSASQARINATRAAAEATQARFALHQLMGLTGEPSWSATQRLPGPIGAQDSVDALLNLAHERRGDLAAARREVEFLGEAVTLARRWRWLGSVEVGALREREQDGTHLTGPTLALALPIFNQGQAGIARAEGQLEDRRARLAALESTVDNAVRLGSARVGATYAIAEQFAKTLVPAQELIVKGQQERQNFMFIGQFELLFAKQQQYDAYQGYLEAVRDYWLARTELVRAIGGRLPSDTSVEEPSVGVDAIITPSEDAMEGMEHMDHDQHATRDDSNATAPQATGDKP